MSQALQARARNVSTKVRVGCVERDGELAGARLVWVRADRPGWRPSAPSRAHSGSARGSSLPFA